MAKAESKSIEELKNYSFFVCAYQRGYRWRETEIRDLIRDLYNFSCETRNNPEDEYCLQPVIVKKRGDGSYELVDGQQRLTTLWLIMQLFSYTDENAIPIQTYSIEYEDKPAFTALLKSISNIARKEADEGLTNLINKLLPETKLNIDCANIVDAITTINNPGIERKSYKRVIEDICNDLNRVTVIWYELEDNEEPISIFTNVNANKIRLTDAELIKAVLLNNIRDKKDRSAFANEWETIEKKLNEDAFWYFLSRGEYTKGTRTDYLFEIWSLINSEYKGQVDNQEEYASFRTVNNAIDNNVSVFQIWNEIKEIIEALEDWYNDYFLYHTIGLLTLINDEKKTTDLFKELYQKYAINTKAKFNDYIKDKIKGFFFGSEEKYVFKKVSRESVAAGLEELDYEDKKAIIKKVLLLYNIASLLRANNEYERFPFDLYNENASWDIEHVNPQTPQDNRDDDEERRIRWLNLYKAFIKDPDLSTEIENCIKNPEDFDGVSAKVIDNLRLPALNSLGNLVLLDSNTNRAGDYGNKSFNEKRKKIIEIERTAQVGKNEAKFIPIGTRWVFLKEYDSADNFQLWTEKDAESYLSDMTEKIVSMFGA